MEYEVTSIGNGIEIYEHCEEIEKTTTTVCLDSSNNGSVDAIESSISSSPEYGSSGSFHLNIPLPTHPRLLMDLPLICLAKTR